MATGVRQCWQSVKALSAALVLCILSCLEGPASGALLPVDSRAPHTGFGAASASQASFPLASHVDGKPYNAFGGRVSAAASPAVSQSLVPPAPAAAEDEGSSSATAVGGAFETDALVPGQGGYRGDLAGKSAHEARGASAESRAVEEGARINAKQQPQQYRQQQPQQYRQQQPQQYRQQQPQQYRQQQPQQYREQHPPSLDGGHGGIAAEPDAAGSEEFRHSGSPPITGQIADGGEAEHTDNY